MPLSLIYAWLGIQVLLGLANLLLRPSFDFLAFALELLAGVAGCSSHRTANPTLNLLGSALDAVFDAFRARSFLSVISVPLV